MRLDDMPEQVDGQAAPMTEDRLDRLEGLLEFVCRNCGSDFDDPLGRSRLCGPCSVEVAGHR